ncbi:MAG: Na/Pi cotransporter family protein [Deltaproteobacteria bacterium]|nr:Na/Pi cotransporter family protein [Deltaproteobacteria bacterium]
MSGFVRAFEIIGGLGVFLFGMKVVSEGLQKAAGTKLRAILDSLTGNRFLGVFTGFFVTSAVQSSSATTVMLVSLVNSGLLGLQQAIPVLYGCEIGTTMTAWLVALFGFKIKISAFALPMVGVGFFVRFLNRPKLTQWGEFLIGFGILFLGIEFMKDAVPDAKNSPGLTAWLAQWRVMEGLGVRFLVLLAGALITGVIQSSSAMIAMVQVMASTGLLDFYTAATLVIGANIGTTATAGLASLAANRTAKRVALAHTTFNTFGSVWALLLLPYFLRFVDGLIPGDPMASAAAVTVHIALVHTMFNVINTSLFLPFVKQMVDLQNRILPVARRRGVSASLHRFGHAEPSDAGARRGPPGSRTHDAGRADHVRPRHGHDFRRASPRYRPTHHGNGTVRVQRRPARTYPPKFF